jgi:hypothetical protein
LERSIKNRKKSKSFYIPKRRVYFIHLLSKGYSLPDDHPLENSKIMGEIIKRDMSLPVKNISEVWGMFGIESRYTPVNPYGILNMLYQYVPLTHMTKWHTRVITGISIIDDQNAILEYLDAADGKKYNVEFNDFFIKSPGLPIAKQHLLSYISPQTLDKPLNTGKINTPRYMKHTVHHGDRIWDFADEYGYIDRKRFTEDVRRLNPGIVFSRLMPGQVIYVPTMSETLKLSTIHPHSFDEPPHYAKDLMDRGGFKLPDVSFRHTEFEPPSFQSGVFLCPNQPFFKTGFMNIYS